MKKYLLILLLLSSCTTNTIPESSGDIQIIFCHKENCTQILQHYADTANSIDCAFYELTHHQLQKSIEQKGSLIVDEDADIEAEKRSGSGLMHNKFCIINQSMIITGSYNPTHRGVYDFNNMILIESRPLAEHYEEIHSQLMEKKKQKSQNTIFMHNGFIIESYACPQDSCQEHIKKTLGEAQKSIHLALFTYTDKEISALIQQKMNEGVVVRGIVESWQSKQYEQYSALIDKGAGVVLEKSSLLQHNKLFVIDRETVIMGSYNPTRSAYTINDENILILRNQEIGSLYVHLIEELINNTQTFK